MAGHACLAAETAITKVAWRDFLGDDAPPIGKFYAPNLTPTHLAEWSDGEIIRAIREGIHRSGRSLLIMPSEYLRYLSDEDVQAIVAYLRSLQPEGVDTPDNKLNVLGAMMVTQAPLFQAQSPITEPVKAPPPGPTAAYGAYLTSFTCEICHGADLLGNADFEAPAVSSSNGMERGKFHRFHAQRHQTRWL